MPSRSVVPIDDTDILDLRAGALCKVGFDGVFYKAKVIDHGVLVYVYSVFVMAFCCVCILCCVPIYKG